MKYYALILIIIKWLVLSAFQITSNSVSKRHFVVQRGNAKIGELTVTEKKVNEKVTYALTSDVLVQFLFTIQVRESIKDVFEHDRLVHSSHQRYVNGALKIDHILQHNGINYTMVDKDKRTAQLNDPIERSTLSIYFSEPKDGQQIYSQNFQCMLRITKTGNHCYAIELPNGSTTTYQYEQGILKQVISDTTWGSIIFIYEKK